MQEERGRPPDKAGAAALGEDSTAGRATYRILMRPYLQSTPTAQAAAAL